MRNIKLLGLELEGNTLLLLNGRALHASEKCILGICWG
jgi:hypothetical protein